MEGMSAVRHLLCFFFPPLDGGGGGGVERVLSGNLLPKAYSGSGVEPPRPMTAKYFAAAQDQEDEAHIAMLKERIEVGGFLIFRFS